MVLASTYPRWAGDPEPGFVHELSKRLADQFRVIAVVPAAVGAAPRERLEGVDVVRFRYAPRRWETLVNDGGILANLRKARWKFLLLPGFFLSQWLTAARIARREDVRAIHAHWLVPQGLVAWLVHALGRKRVPYLVTSHGADLFALRGRVFTAMKRLVAKRAGAVTVVSAAMRDEMARVGIEASQVHVQPMGVDLAHRFTPRADAARSPGEILFVGRLVGKKGLRHLIDAMPAVIAAHPEAFLTVVGFGPEEAACREQVRALGLESHVRFTGAIAQDGLPALYRRAAVFVAPFVRTADGDQEGLGLVVVEAAGCGCPVVVSDLPAVRDVFAGGYAPAAIVEAGSVEELAHAISGVLANPPDTRDLRASLLDRFDWAVVAEGYAERLTRLAREGRQ
ncbi:glycosyltransferase [Arenimonas sp.]|uniref:glycosyltransferase n=1 Tax=Arenimonas sp. TaxID=1872635 RepID=UPI002D7E6974|nr:glycosyltransferase [Arenimonas sp.]